MVTEPPTPAAPKTLAAAPAARPRRSGKLSWILFIALVLVSFWAYELSQENRALRDPQVQAQRVVAEMSKHIILPENELPVIGPIDKAQAKEPFFENAQDGDLFVVYRSTQQAFIYSPARKILVNAGVLAVNPEQEQVEDPEEPQAEEEPGVAEEI